VHEIVNGAPSLLASGTLQHFGTRGAASTPSGAATAREIRVGQIESEREKEEERARARERESET
jgi:hypothetical protein